MVEILASLVGCSLYLKQRWGLQQSLSLPLPEWPEPSVPLMSDR
jgi:hypothetical protein